MDTRRELEREVLLDPESARVLERKRRFEERRIAQDSDTRSMSLEVPYRGKKVTLYTSTFNKRTGTITRALNALPMPKIMKEVGDHGWSSDGTWHHAETPNSEFLKAYYAEVVKLMPNDRNVVSAYLEKLLNTWRSYFRNHAFAPVPECVDVEITNYCTFGCDYCAVPGTEIDTPDGKKPIEDIKVGDKVMASDNGRLVVAEVAEIYEREVDEDLVKIELEDGRELLLTRNHEVFTTNRGWITAGELTEQDDLEIIDHC